MSGDRGFTDAINTVLRTFNREHLSAGEYEQLQFALFNVLTMIWNTRGKADVAAVAWSLASEDIDASARQTIQELVERAVTNVDR